MLAVPEFITAIAEFEKAANGTEDEEGDVALMAARPARIDSLVSLKLLQIPRATIRIEAKYRGRGRFGRPSKIRGYG